MRRTSRAFLQVGAILGIIAGILLLIFGALMIAASFAKPGDEFLKIFEAVIKVYFNNRVDLFLKAAMAYGIALVICAICAIVSAVFCFIAKGKPTKSNFIVVIVLSLLGGSVFATLGGIFGLIAQAQARNNPSEPKEVEEKKEQE